MLNLYQAFGFEKEITENATSKPWLVSGIRPDGTTCQLVVKFLSAKGSGKNYAKESELICAELAPQFGLQTPPFGLISFSPEFVQSLSEAYQKRLREGQPSPYFCSELLTGYVIPSPSVSVDQYDLENIVAFDLFLRNPDRRVSKPNLIISGTNLRLIDHELCLGGIEGITEKVRNGDLEFLSTQPGIDRHLLSRNILARVEAGEEFLFDEFQENLSRLNLDFLDSYIQRSGKYNLDPDFLHFCREYFDFARRYSHRIKQELSKAFGLLS